jgi:hypothetical protein
MTGGQVPVQARFNSLPLSKQVKLLYHFFIKQAVDFS